MVNYLIVSVMLYVRVLFVFLLYVSEIVGCNEPRPGLPTELGNYTIPLVQLVQTILFTRDSVLYQPRT
jgi:hypothetical protein